MKSFSQKLLRFPGDTNLKNRCVLVKQDLLTLRLILMFRPMSITVTSRQLKCSLYHYAFQALLSIMACTFKNTVILQNPSRATNYNRSTTEGLSEKTVDRRMIFLNSLAEIPTKIIHVHVTLTNTTICTSLSYK